MIVANTLTCTRKARWRVGGLPTQAGSLNFLAGCAEGMGMPVKDRTVELTVRVHGPRHGVVHRHTADMLRAFMSFIG